MLAKGLKKEQVAVDFEPRRLRVATTDTQGKLARRDVSALPALACKASRCPGPLHTPCQLTVAPSLSSALAPTGQEDYTLDLALHGEVVPGESRFEVLGTKVEIKLRKAEAQQWPALEQGQQRADAEAAPVQAPAAAAAEQPAAAPLKPTPAYPYAG